MRASRHAWHPGDSPLHYRTGTTRSPLFRDRAASSFRGCRARRAAPAAGPSSPQPAAQPPPCPRPPRRFHKSFHSAARQSVPCQPERGSGGAAEQARDHVTSRVTPAAGGGGAMGGRLPSGRAGDHKHLGRHEECAGSQALTWAAARPLLQSSSARASSAPPPPLVMTHGTGETLKRRAASAAAPHASARRRSRLKVASCGSALSFRVSGSCCQWRPRGGGRY